MYNLAGACIVIGLAALSVIAHLCSGGVIGWGWGFLAVLVLLLWDWHNPDKEKGEADAENK